MAVTFCDICMPEAFCGFETVRKKALLNLWVLWEKEKSFVRERTPQRVTCVSSLREGVFYFSQKNTDEQNAQTFTETLSQPITQNLTANTHHPTPFFSCNVLWPLYAEGLLWVRNVGGKVLLDLWVLWEKELPRESLNCSFSHRRTQINRTHSIPQRH